MNLEQKKKLAEFMGWKFGEYPHSEIFIWKNKNQSTLLIAEWNPDTNHVQFAEVWNKLEESQQEEVMFLGADSSKKWTSTLLNDLPKVMEAVLEILEIAKEK